MNVLVFLQKQPLEVCCKKGICKKRKTSVKFSKFLRTPIFTEHLRWLLLFINMSVIGLIYKSRRLRKLSKVSQNTLENTYNRVQLPSQILSCQFSKKILRTSMLYNSCKVLLKGEMSRC